MQQIKKVVIAGGGTAGWLAGAALSKKLAGVVDVVLVESDEIGTVGVGEATIPPMRVFHQLLGIDEQEFMRATSATFKLGIEFENWGKLGESYIHSFGNTGKGAWMCQFVHFWLRAKELGYSGEFGDYCYELQAAKANKFGLSANMPPISYAYHLDATAYAKYLRAFSEKNGLQRVEGKIQSVQQNDSTGFIESIILASGECIEGDLFIDCTGFRGVLIEQTLNTGYEDWSHWLPCDSAAAVQTESSGEPIPYTKSIARESGWQWRIPLQHRTGNGLVYCSHYLTDVDAINQLQQNLDGKALTDPRTIKFRTGRRRKIWNKNCVALGLSSGFLEPLESTSIYLFMIGISRLMQSFPFSGIYPSVIDEFNNTAIDELEKIRDFIILHYKVTDRDDTPFWRYCKNMDIPDSLAQRIELFKEYGHIFQLDGELFRIDSWTQVMLGQGIVPKQYHHVTQTMTDRELQSFLAAIKNGINQAVEKLPAHHDFIKSYCKI
ncbi:tryptophan halogenase family protein [Teredinibacter waterburyi]|uniref:tryptophan halogenase family protein n=1 Tax=Teredinibacter waterburyi TaxID=1500538 RepID=UPI0016600186|nr:tryptophan halogenase family protein [Teredinibacter waterburyi]